MAEDPALLQVTPGGPGVFLLRGEFDLSGVPVFEDAVSRSLVPGTTVMLDLSRLTFLDCGGARAIARSARTLRRGSLVVREAHGSVRKLLDLVEIGSVPNIVYDPTRSHTDPETGVDTATTG